MKEGQQTTGLSFWDHGVLVCKHYSDLFGDRKFEWRLPSWFVENETKIKLELAPHQTRLQLYQIWHDLGKPFCRTVDSDGKVHYPNHAQVSAEIWLKLGGDPHVADLIRDDMLCHTLRPADAATFATNPNALALLITALCELHANATMFGGIESESFKIKWKRLSKCGQIIINQLFKE